MTLLLLYNNVFSKSYFYFWDHRRRNIIGDGGVSLKWNKKTGENAMRKNKIIKQTRYIQTEESRKKILSMIATV